MDRLAARDRLASSAVFVVSVVLAVGIAFSGLAACGDLKSATPGTEGGDAGQGSSGSSGTNNPKQGLPGNVGPGEHGSLPSGYCCTDDSQCRDRHCVAAGSGGSMCQDACRVQSTCNRRDLTAPNTFKCSSTNLGDDGWCEPENVSFTCILQARFERGTRKDRECCDPTGDGNAGEECEGNKCVAVNEKDQNNPFVCSHWCELTKDCPSGMLCSPFNSCVPANRPYTCGE